MSSQSQSSSPSPSFHALIMQAVTFFFVVSLVHLLGRLGRDWERERERGGLALVWNRYFPY